VKQAELPGAGGLHGGQGWRRAWDGPELARVGIHQWNWLFNAPRVIQFWRLHLIAGIVARPSAFLGIVAVQADEALLAVVACAVGLPCGKRSIPCACLGAEASRPEGERPTSGTASMSAS
jgi:hypothetical protein